MKIAIIAYINLAYGMGATRRVTMLAQGLRDCGDEVHLLGGLRGDHCAVPQGLAGIQIHSCDNAAQGSAPLLAIGRRALALRDVHHLTCEGLDWLLLYNLGLDALPYALLARMRGCAVATDNCDVRRGGNLFQPRLLADALSYRVGNSVLRSWAKLNIVVSRCLRDAVLRSAPAVPVHMLPALIDTDSFRPCPERGAQFRRDWALGNDTLIVYLGGTQRFEGVADLLSAARILLVRRKRFRLIVAGEMVQGPFHDDLPGLVKENGLEGCILLPGRLNLQGVLGALAAADILVLPKRHDQANIAGFPQKLTEYLAAGKPVVTTNVGDVPLYLQDGETALLCEPDSPSALADAIQRVLDCPDLARHLADGARKLAVALFDRNVQAKALSDKLKSIHRRGSASAHPSS